MKIAIIAMLALGFFRPALVGDLETFCLIQFAVGFDHMSLGNGKG
jgi:hypothetical protein